MLLLPLWATGTTPCSHSLRVCAVLLYRVHVLQPGRHTTKDVIAVCSGLLFQYCCGFTSNQLCPYWMHYEALPEGCSVHCARWSFFARCRCGCARSLITPSTYGSCGMLRCATNAVA